MLERCTTSYGALHGECAVWLNADTLCDKPLGHDGNHRGHGPYFSNCHKWVEYDTDGNKVGNIRDSNSDRRKVCGLCGHEIDFATCGSASADHVDLCHADDHSCYHEWTVYKRRPNNPSTNGIEE